MATTLHTRLVRVVRFGAVAGVGIALLLSAGCHAGATRPDADADAGVSDQDPGGADLEEEDPTATASVRIADPQVAEAVRAYEGYIRAQAAGLPRHAHAFTDAVRRGDLAAAKKNFASSRAGWQRIQSIGILLPALDRGLDARVDDFASPTDPAWTGWHRLEYILWHSGSTAGAAPYANRLDADLTRLGRAVGRLTITAPIMTTGIDRLVEEAIAEKLPGIEDRYARTDLADLAANLDGARAGYGFTKPVLTGRQPALVRTIDGQFAVVDRTLARYRKAGVYRPYPALTAGDRAALLAQLTTLAETLAGLPSVVR